MQKISQLCKIIFTIGHTITFTLFTCLYIPDRGFSIKFHDELKYIHFEKKSNL